MWQEKTDSLVKQGQPVSDDLAAFKWMIEELRVSLFAQELKTPYPVSVKRLNKEFLPNLSENLRKKYYKCWKKAVEKAKSWEED